jgi:hypothetical protein
MKTKSDEYQQTQINASAELLAIGMFASCTGHKWHDLIPTMFGHLAMVELLDRAEKYEWDYEILMWRIPEFVISLAKWAETSETLWRDCEQHRELIRNWCCAHQFKY